MASKLKLNDMENIADSERFKRAESIVEAQPSGLSAPATTALSTASIQDERGVYLENVPIELIDVNPFNARRIYVPERIKDLSDSIAASGQLTPGIGTKRDGRYILVAGHYRLRAIKLAGIKTMSLMIHEDLTDQQLYQISYKENDERTQQSALDNALSWQDLIDKNVYASEAAIAEVTGQSRANINRTMAVLKLSEPILDIIKQAPQNYPATTLYELFLLEQVAGLEPTLAMAEKVGSGEVGRKEINEYRSTYGAPVKKRNRKENGRQYKLQVKGKDSGTIKEWDSGRVMVDITLEDASEREALIELLKTRFH